MTRSVGHGLFPQPPCHCLIGSGTRDRGYAWGQQRGLPLAGAGPNAVVNAESPVGQAPFRRVTS